MKITWFGGTTLRLHLGGQIVVIDATGVPVGIDRRELEGGADRSIDLEAELPIADAVGWKPRGAQRLLDAGEAVRPVETWSIGEGALLIDADGESPLLILTEQVPDLGRWAERAVIVLLGTDLAGRGQAVLTQRVPRLLVIGGIEGELDAAFGMLAPLLDGAGLMALERGLALEA